MHNKKKLCSFGNFSGFFLESDCDSRTNGAWSTLGYDGYYELPEGVNKRTEEARTYLAGEFNFKVLEFEVYLL